MISRIVYVSKATRGFARAELEELRRDAATRNQALSVTGYLSLRQGSFFQYLEGEAAVVDELMQRITRDSRHEIVVVLPMGTSDVRLFPDWGMRHLTAEDRVAIGVEDVLVQTLKLLSMPRADLVQGRKIVLGMCARIASWRSRGTDRT